MADDVADVLCVPSLRAVPRAGDHDGGGLRGTADGAGHDGVVGSGDEVLGPEHALVEVAVHVRAVEPWSVCQT